MKFNIRYQGQTHEYDDETYNPRNFGTKRLNIRVNSSSVAKFGLTTNTNALEYCRFKVRVGGETAYIARTYTTSYISGETPVYNGSVSAARSVSTTMQSESQSALTSQSVTVVTSSASVSTNQVSSSYTGTTGSGSYSSPSDPGKYTNENSTGSTVVTLNTLNNSVITAVDGANGYQTSAAQPSINQSTYAVAGNATSSIYKTSATALVNTVLATRNAGSGTGQVIDGNGVVRTVTNNTGSSVTSNVALAATGWNYSSSMTSTWSMTYNYNPGTATATAEHDYGTYKFSYHTTRKLTASELIKDNAAANLGPGVSAANPINAAYTNATGSTVVTRTQSWNSLTKVDTWYSRSQVRAYHKWTNNHNYARQFPALGANKSLSSRHSNTQTYVESRSTWTIAAVNNYAAVNTAAGWGNASTQTTQSGAASNWEVSSTRRIMNTTLKTSAEQAYQGGAWTTYSANGKSVTRSFTKTRTQTSNVSASIASTSKSMYATRKTQSYSYAATAAKQAVQTYYSSYYAARWSYWSASSRLWTRWSYSESYYRSEYTKRSTYNVSTSSCSKYTNSTYNASTSTWKEYKLYTYDVHTTSCSKASSTTYYTSKSSSTSSVSETLHNMNL